MDEARGSRDVERFRTIYDESFDDLTAYCRRRVPPALVDDIVAESLAIAWRRLEDMPTGDDARPWLFGVARNLVRSESRRHGRSQELKDRLVNEMTVRPNRSNPAEAPAPDEVQALVDALYSLKEMDQEVIRLAVWEDLDHAQIATIVDCSENAVTIRLHRARARLLKQLRRDPRWRDAPVAPVSGLHPGAVDVQVAERHVPDRVKGHAGSAPGDDDGLARRAEEGPGE